MLTGFAVIFLIGLTSGWLFRKMKLPGLLGMILAGIAAGPNMLNIISGDVLAISSQIRQTALVIVLMRAGLSLDFKELKKAGRPAFMMCFVPATFEIAGTVLIAPWLFGISRMEAALTGAVIAAVSPAVVVPGMLKVMGEKYGTGKQIPQMILAGASADDVFVIVLFTSFLSILRGGTASVFDFVQIPLSIVLGIASGIITGMLLSLYFRKVSSGVTVKVIVSVSAAFLLMGLQDISENYIRVSGLIGIMALGMTLFAKDRETAAELSAKYKDIWSFAEILLFVLVGAAVDLKSVPEFGVKALALLAFAMIFRMTGVFVSVSGKRLSYKERFFCMLAYTPKATVQAAICTVPLSYGLECGNMILCVAVLAILITAPFGAFMIDLTYKRFLSRESVGENY